MMIPMVGQYEQQANALAASKLGVPVVKAIDTSFVKRLNAWIKSDDRVWVSFADETAEIVDGMVKKYAR
ncbi:hypothetical protein [Mucilaginibacter antarcticus]